MPKRKSIQNLVEMYTKQDWVKRATDSHQAEIHRVLDDMISCCGSISPGNWTEQNCYDYLRMNSGLAMSTQRKRTYTLKGFWSWAEHRGFIYKSPARKIVPPPAVERELFFPVITSEMVRAVGLYVDDYTYAAMVAAWGCAIRVDSLLRFSEGLVNEELMTVQSNNGNAGGFYFAPIPDRIILKSLYDLAELKIKNPINHPRKRWQSQLEFGIDAAGVKPFGFSDLRNHRIDCWIKEGHAPLTIMAWTGIQGMGTLMKHYSAALIEDEIKDARPQETGLKPSY